MLLGLVSMEQREEVNSKDRLLNVDCALHLNRFILLFDVRFDQDTSDPLADQPAGDDGRVPLKAPPLLSSDISCRELQEQVINPLLLRHGVCNVARRLVGKSLMFEVDFTSSANIVTLLKHITPTNSSFYDEFSRSVKDLYDVDVSLSCSLHLMEVQPFIKHYLKHQVTLDNVDSCACSFVQSSVIDFNEESLRQPNIREFNLYDALRDLRGLGRWFTLAIQLHIPYHIVDGIKCTYGEGSERGLIEVIQYWINNGKPSWAALVDSIRKVGFPTLAKQLATKYGCLHIMNNPTELMENIKLIEELEEEKANSEKLTKTTDEVLNCLREDLEMVKDKLLQVEEHHRGGIQGRGTSTDEWKGTRDELKEKMSTITGEIQSKIEEYVSLQGMRDNITQRINDCYAEIDRRLFLEEMSTSLDSITDITGEYEIIDSDTPSYDGANGNDTLVSSKRGSLMSGVKRCRLMSMLKKSPCNPCKTPRNICSK